MLSESLVRTGLDLTKKLFRHITSSVTINVGLAVRLTGAGKLIWQAVDSCWGWTEVDKKVFKDLLFKEIGFNFRWLSIANLLDKQLDS